MSIQIDVQCEQLVAIQDAPLVISKWLPNQRTVSLSAIHRWLKVGVSGVRLESIVVAGTRYTSKEALNRFFNASGRARSNQRSCSHSC